MRSIPGLVVAALVFVGCAERRAPEIDAGTGGFDAGVLDAGSAPPAQLAIGVFIECSDGGLTPLAPEAIVAPTSALQLALPVRLTDFRVRLVDWTDHVVASDDELSADGRHYRVGLLAPLATGRAFTLHLEAERGLEMVDEAGATYEDWSLPFRVAGEVEAPPAPKPGRKRKRR